jgi:uncharacterized protein
MTKDSLHYPSLIDHAMRQVVRDVLQQISSTGLPGEHHFYISFNTTYPGVKMSDTLRGKYPKEITVVLQHQFWDFKVEEHQFQVTLSFSGVPEKLVIPYAALTAFADPSVKFGLQFQPTEMFDAQITDVTTPLAVTVSVENQDAGTPAEIISLDTFRKK